MTGSNPIQPADLFRLQSIMDGRISPDGRTFCYVLSRVDEEKDEEYSALWLLDIENGRSHQLTYGNHIDSSPAWSPDGKEIAFLSTRGEKPQIYRIPVQGGEAAPVTKLKQGVGSGPTWSPDGRWLAFTASSQEELADPKAPYRVNRSIFRFDGIGYLDAAVQDLYLVSAAGVEVRPLTHDAWNNTSPRWSPDGSELLYLANFNPDSHRLHPALRRIDLNGNIHDILPDWGNINDPLWSKDGGSIIFTGQPKGLPMGHKNDLWVVAKTGGEPECRTAALEIGVAGDLQGDFPGVEFQGRMLLSPDGETALVKVQNGGALGLYRITLKGPEAWEPVLTGERMNALYDTSQDHLLYSVSTFDDPGDIYIADLQGNHQRRLTRINAEVEAKWCLPETEHLMFQSFDGQPVEGWVMKPAQGEAPFPTVLYIHGGPTGAFGSIFSFDFHLLTAAGYAVLFINPRGSSGYGSPFATAITAAWGNLDYQDLMAGVDHVIQLGIADPDHLGVAGLSYGGYMSCWIIGQTDRFKAAVPENPVINLRSVYGTSDISVSALLSAMGGGPVEEMEAYRRCSPITYAHRCTTPTLLIQGEADYRCPAEQSEQFYKTLKANGCVVEMLRLPGGSHLGSVTGPIALRKAQNEALVDWMDKYVKKES
jgi:dipeptidyl aminopeptidase/acylaminoacyl peptidase